jgi:hypothetical protein
MFLVDSLKANQKNELHIKFETDSSARIIIPAEEAEQAVQLKLKSVASYCHRIGSSDWTPNPELGQTGLIRDDRWELTITPKQIVVWSPLTTGMFGGIKEKQGKATGGVVPFDYIDQIDRIDRETSAILTFRIAKGDILTDGMAIELEFQDKNSASEFCTVLSEAIPAYWTEEVKTAEMMLGLGLYGSDAPEELYRKMGEYFTRIATADIDAIRSEVEKLRDINWSDSQTEFSISLVQAGAPITLTA